MPSYEYIAKDRLGNELTGLYRDIDGMRTLRKELTKVGYSLVRARRTKETAGRARRVKPQEIVAFAYKFHGMYSAGLSVIRCLETLEKQTDRPALRDAIADVRQRIEAGSSIAKGFEPHRDIFSDFFVGMLEAGETAGRLSEALSLSTLFLEKRAQLRAKITSALVYPIVVGVVCLSVLTCLLLFVVPVFMKLYAHLHVPLPVPTQILVTLSLTLRHRLWLVMAAAGASVWAASVILKHGQIRRHWDRLKTRLPVLGRLNRLILVSRFIRPFAMLAAVGVSVMEAMRIAGSVTHNEEMSRISEELQKAAQAGNPVGKALEAHEMFPPVIVQMAASGEQVGKLPEMLGKAVDILDRDIERMVDSLVVKLEPLLTLVMGIVIGLVLMGVYLPMFDYMTYLK